MLRVRAAANEGRDARVHARRGCVRAAQIACVCSCVERACARARVEVYRARVRERACVCACVRSRRLPAITGLHPNQHIPLAQGSHT